MHPFFKTIKKRVHFDFLPVREWFPETCWYLESPNIYKNSYIDRRFYYKVTIYKAFLYMLYLIKT